MRNGAAVPGPASARGTAAGVGTLKVMWADSGYDGAPLARYALAVAAITVEVVKRTSPHSFQVVRRR